MTYGRYSIIVNAICGRFPGRLTLKPKCVRNSLDLGAVKTWELWGISKTWVPLRLKRLWQSLSATESVTKQFY